MDINKLFYSDTKGKAHDKCVFCEDKILKSGFPYIIEKAFRFNNKENTFETIFDYALCFECMERISSEMSKESTKKVRKYFNTYKNKKDLNTNIENRLKTCIITEKDVNKMKEYQIAGFFIKGNIVKSDLFPYAIGEEAIEEIQELISEKTRDFLNKFKDIILPPDVREKFPKDRVLIF